MKKSLVVTATGLAALLLLNGCIVLSLGGGTKTTNETPKITVGQQLLDLQKAKESGAITETEYQAQKAKILGHK
jgi:hypothetical protein